MSYYSQKNTLVREELDELSERSLTSLEQAQVQLCRMVVDGHVWMKSNMF